VADALGEQETLRWLQRIDGEIQGLRGDMSRREDRYVSVERHEIEFESIHAEVKDLKDSVKWAFRTAIGAVMAVIVGVVTAWLKLKGGP
jgi:hypothetical protein